MPTPVPTATKAQARRDLSNRIGDWWAGTFSSSGNGGGTTAVDSSLIGYGDDYQNSKFLLLGSGSYAGQWRRVADFTDASGTFTTVNAYGGQVASGVTYEVHNIRPDLFTAAVNEAVRLAYPAIFRPVLCYGGLIADSSRSVYAVPHGMRDVLRVSIEEADSNKGDDDFDRDDSTSTAGSSYTAVAGTWGISSDKLYSVSDANADLLIRDTGVADGIWQARIQGTLNHASTYRSPALVFRYTDSSNYLAVRLLNGAVDLRRVSGGSESSLATASVTTADGTDYVLRVMATGARIRVFLDETEVLQHELAGANAKYLGYTSCGFRLDKGGSPATAARWADYRMRSLVGLVDRTDWEQDAGGRTLSFGRTGAGLPYLTTGRLIVVEGRSPLTPLAEDTTWGTLASDSTATLEIERTDPDGRATPEWSLLMQYAEAELFDAASKPGSQSADPDTRAEYRAAAGAARTKAEAMRKRLAMPQPRVQLRRPAYHGAVVSQDTVW